jgi:serine/threonine-protein kinase
MSAGGILSAQAHQPPPRFASWGIESVLPVTVEAVVQACLAKDPADRPQSARDLAERYGEALGQRIWDEPEMTQPVAPVAVDSPTSTELPDDPNAVIFRLEAWMPEQVAAVKLRGFLDAAGGEVVESVPGLIRVCFWRRKSTGPQVSSQRRRWPWSGFQRHAEQKPQLEQYHMDVSLEKPAPDESSRLRVTVRLRPVTIPLQGEMEWRDWCENLHRNLKAYLMAHA